MQYTVTPSPETGSPRRAAVNALAIVGFIALVFLGIWLAIYAASFIPAALTRIGEGLGLAGGSNASGGLSVVPPRNEVIEYEWEPVPAAPAAPSAPAKPATPAPKPSVPSNQVIGYQTIITDYPTPGSVQIPAGGQAALYGDPNLVARITAVGYVDSRGNNFREDDSIDRDDRLAVKFTVTNAGTNKSGSWKARVTLPTRESRSFDYTSRSLESLNPGDRMELIAYVDRGDARVGRDLTVTVEADPRDEVRESNERDNYDSARITVRD